MSKLLKNINTVAIATKYKLICLKNVCICQINSVSNFILIINLIPKCNDINWPKLRDTYLMYEKYHFICNMYRFFDRCIYVIVAIATIFLFLSNLNILLIYNVIFFEMPVNIWFIVVLKWHIFIHGFIGQNDLFS